MKKTVECKYYSPINKITCFCQKQNKEVPRWKCDKKCELHEFEPVAFVVVGVGRCDVCPLVKKTRTPRTGCAFDYYCKAVNDKKIVGYIEWDSEIPPIPDWCPFREEEE